MHAEGHVEGVVIGEKITLTITHEGTCIEVEGVLDGENMSGKWVEKVEDKENTGTLSVDQVKMI